VNAIGNASFLAYNNPEINEKKNPWARGNNEIEDPARL